MENQKDDVSTKDNDNQAKNTKKQKPFSKTNVWDGYIIPHYK